LEDYIPSNKQFSNVYNNIKYYKRMISISMDEQQRLFYERQLDKEIGLLNQLAYQQTEEEKQPEQREFTYEELAIYDGSRGKAAYVAINGIVYDVSIEATWGGGTHFGIFSGRDASVQFNECHGGNEEVLRNLPKVGWIKIDGGNNV
jgi:predicted heme/steroid binding protein